MPQGPTRLQRDPLLKLPDIRADFERAALFDSYSDEQAAAYLLGLNAHVVTPDFARAFTTSTKARKYLELTDALKFANGIRADDGRIDPRKLVSWAELKRLRIPSGLRRVAQSSPSECGTLDDDLNAELEKTKKLLAAANSELARLRAETKPLDPKEKRSLQIIALASAIRGMGYRGKQSNVPADIAGAAASLGLSITSPVVSDKLKMAVQDLELDWSLVNN